MFLYAKLMPQGWWRATTSPKETWVTIRMAKWFVNRNGKQAGPFESAQLKKFASEGTIKPDDQIRREDQEKWHKAESVNGLFLAQKKQPQVVRPKVSKESDELRSTELAIKHDNELQKNNTLNHQSACDWYRIENDQSLDPVPFNELCEQYKAGVIGATDFIAQKGMKWVQAGVFLEQCVVESATSEDEWYIFQIGKKCGPNSLSDLRSMMSSGYLHQTDLIGRKGSRGLAASSVIPSNKDVFLERVRGIPEQERRILAGGVGVLLFLPLWLLGGSLLGVVAIGFLSGYMTEANGDRTDCVSILKLPKLSRNPFPFLAFVALVTFIAFFGSSKLKQRKDIENIPKVEMLDSDLPTNHPSKVFSQQELEFIRADRRLLVAMDMGFLTPKKLSSYLEMTAELEGEWREDNSRLFANMWMLLLIPANKWPEASRRIGLSRKEYIAVTKWTLLSAGVNEADYESQLQELTGSSLQQYPEFSK